MQRAVEARTDHFRQTRVQLNEVEPILTGRDYIEHTRDQRTAIRDQECSRLDLKAQLRTGFAGIVFKQTSQAVADVLIVNLRFRLQRFNSVAATEIDNRNRAERLRYIESVRRDSQPSHRIMTRADVMVNALDLEAILLHQSADRAEILVPYSKT